MAVGDADCFGLRRLVGRAGRGIYVKMKIYYDLPPSAISGFLLGKAIAYRDEYMRKSRDGPVEMRKWYVVHARHWNHRALYHLRAAREAS